MIIREEAEAARRRADIQRKIAKGEPGDAERIRFDELRNYIAERLRTTATRGPIRIL